MGDFGRHRERVPGRQDGSREPLALELGWATPAQVRHACEQWHYSGTVPTGKLVPVGAWEEGRFVGVVLFSRGSSPHLGTRWGLGALQVCELTRVAFLEHRAPLTMILSRAVGMLRRQSPGVELVVSFADPARGHHGGLYQAAGWTYTGLSNGTTEYFYGGRWRHVASMYPLEVVDGRLRHGGEPIVPLAQLAQRSRPGKHRYVLPLRRRLRRLAEAERLPYPKPGP